MTGKPAGSAILPPPVAPELEGAPGAQTVKQSPIEHYEYSSSSSVPESEEEKAVTSTDTEHETPAVSPEQQQRVDATAGTDRQIKTIKDWMDAEGNRPETPEERKKRERKEKSKRIIAAVSDGISALSNLFFTSQYAPNMYNHEKGSMTNSVDARIERMKAEREKNADKYLQFSLKLGDLENQRAATLRELEAQQERLKLAREKAQREAEAHGWLAALQPDKQREQAGKANKAEQDAIAAKAVADTAPEMQRAKLETEHARKGSYDASAENSRASAAAHNRSNPKEFTAWDEHGRPHPFATKAAAELFAKQHGTWKEEDVTQTSETDSETNGKSTTTTKKKSGHPARPAQGTMPGVRDERNMPETN